MDNGIQEITDNDIAIEQTAYIPADITVDDLTKGSIINDPDNTGEFKWIGSGVFDRLMEAVNSNIRVEYDNGRIEGSDYAQVYLGGIQSVIQQSIHFLLVQQLTEAQIDTERDKLITAEKQRDLLDVQIQQEQYKLDNLLPDQHLIYQADLVLKEDDHQIKQDSLVTEALKRDLLDVQIENEKKKIGVDLLQIQMSAWSQAYNSSKIDNRPDLVDNSTIETLYNELRSQP